MERAARNRETSRTVSEGDVYAYTHARTHAHIHTRTRVYICIYVYMYICIYVYMYICIYVYIYIYIHQRSIVIVSVTPVRKNARSTNIKSTDNVNYGT